MVCSVSGLKGFIELVVGHVLLELISDCTFKFTKEGKVGKCM